MGRLVIGLKACKDLGLTTVLLVGVSAYSGLDVPSFALSCTGADEYIDRTAKGFFDAGSFSEAFALSKEPSLFFFIERCRSESMSRIPCTSFMVRSFVRSTETRSSLLRGLDGTFTMGGVCAWVHDGGSR